MKQKKAYMPQDVSNSLLVQNDITRDTSRTILDLYEKNYSRSISFTLNLPAPSLNHQHVFKVLSGRNGKKKMMAFLDPKVKMFRKTVEIILKSKFRTWDTEKSKAWDSEDIYSIVILFYSPWITLKNTIKKKDLDNRIKTLLDAIEHATGIPDQNLFNIHAFKIDERDPKKEKIEVYLFSLFV